MVSMTELYVKDVRLPLNLSVTTNSVAHVANHSVSSKSGRCLKSIALIPATRPTIFSISNHADRSTY